jgi:hypothetical protein
MERPMKRIILLTCTAALCVAGCGQRTATGIPDAGSGDSNNASRDGRTDGASGDAAVPKSWPFITSGFVNAVKAGPGGDVYITGKYFDKASFDGKTYASHGAADLFVARLSPGGKPRWILMAGSWGNDVGAGLAVDAAGSAVVTGFFDNKISLGGTTLIAKARGALVFKLSPAGKPVWAASPSGADVATGASVALDAAGNPHVTGWLQGTASFGASVVKSPNAGGSVFVAKLSSGGKWTWALTASAADKLKNSGQQIAVDSKGNVMIAGHLGSSVTFGSKTCAAKYQAAIFVLQVSASGQVSWLQCISSTPYGSLPLGLAVDPFGSTYLTGMIKGESAFGGVVKSTAAAGSIPFVTKLSPLGGFEWVNLIPHPPQAGLRRLSDVAIDPSGSPIVVGAFTTSVKLGKSVVPVPAPGTYGIVIAGLSPTGTYSWAKLVGGSKFGVDIGPVAVSAAGKRHVVGRFRYQLLLPDKKKYSDGEWSTFVTELD